MRQFLRLTAVAAVLCWAGARSTQAGDDWNAPLRDATTTASRVVVRSGGTCHREPASETVLAETTDPADLRSLLAAIEIDPDSSGFACMCCGDPTIELYSGEQLLLSLGYHHGRSLRWVDGWEGDGQLTEASATKLAVWMSSHGVEGPSTELAEGRAHEQAASKRADRQMAALPPEITHDLELAESEEDAIAAFTSRGREGVLAAFAVLGCHRGPWNQGDNFERFLTDSVLRAVPDAQLHQAVAELQPETPAARGCARYLFATHKAFDRADREVVDKALPAICSEVLSDHPPLNRRIVIAALGKLGTPNAVARLRALLTDGMPLASPEDPAGEGGSWITSAPGWGELKAAEGDLTVAAEALALSGDRESLPLLQALLGTCPEADRERVQAALDELRAKP